MKRIAAAAGVALALALAAGQAVAAGGHDGPGCRRPPKHGGWERGCRPAPKPARWGWNHPRPWCGSKWGYRPAPPPPPVVVYKPHVYSFPYNTAPRWW